MNRTASMPLMQTGSLPRWLRYLFRPRLALGESAAVASSVTAQVLTMLSGMSLIAGPVAVLASPRTISLTQALSLAVVGVMIGSIWIRFGSLLLHTVSARLRGDASIEETRDIVARAATPMLIPLVLWLAALLVLPGSDIGSPVATIWMGMWSLALFWSFLLLLASLSFVNHFGLFRAAVSVLLTYGLALTLLVAALLLLGLGATISESRMPQIPPPLLVGLLVAGAVINVIMAVHRQNERPYEQTLSGLAAAHAELRPQLSRLEVSGPWQERLLRPAWERITRFGTRLTPSDQIYRLRRDLVLAGRSPGLSVTDLLGARVLAGACLAALLFFATRRNYPVSQVISFAGLGFMLGFYLPIYWLRRQVRQRQRSIRRNLPDALDMLTICVDAGLGFDAAIQRVAFRWQNPLAIELRHVVSEVRVGVARSEALHHLVERTEVPDVASFVALIAQAERLGVPVGNVLRTQSQQLRIRRRQRVEEEAHKAPVKMLFPLAFFILPATFAVILGPALPRIIRLFGSM